MIFEPTNVVNNVDNGKKCTMSPSCTGTSVIAMKYKSGIVIAADTLISYGSLARYMGFNRVVKVNDLTVMGCSGDIADFQLIKRRVEEYTHEESLLADGFNLSPAALHSWITRVLYNRRSNFNPLWNSYIVGGIETNKEPYLGFCNMIGVSFPEDCVATGFGAFLAVPHLRDVMEKKAGGDYKKLEENDAIEAITNGMRLLYYRDCRAFNQYQMAIVRPTGVEMRGPLRLETKWDIAEYVSGFE